MRPDIQPAFPVEIADEDIRAKLIELHGLAPIPDEVDILVSSSEEVDSLRITSLSYANSLGETVPGIMMEPLDGSGDHPGIACVSGTGGSAERVAHPDFHQSPDGPLIGWGRELARRGFVTLAISARALKVVGQASTIGRSRTSSWRPMAECRWASSSRRPC